MSIFHSISQRPNPNSTTPAFTDDVEWFAAYLQTHALSQTSWRYAYIFWLAIGLVTLTFTVFRALGLRSGTLGAYWTKWSLRRRTWRKKHSLAHAKNSGRPHKQPLLLPSNAQLLCLLSLTAACLAATFAGPNYIAPARKLWEFRRAAVPEVAAYSPQYTIWANWWTSGDRAGLITFALFPLCILFVLKRPPFAIFAISFLTNIHFDKLVWLHRWTGWLIWAMAALHASLWSVQLVEDIRSGTDKAAYAYAWQSRRFIYAWTAFGLLTLLNLLSLGHVREKHYEIFYALHVFLVPVTIVMSALHYPPLWWWCWSALLLWAGERAWRALNWLYINGFLGSCFSTPPIAPSDEKLSIPSENWESRSNVGPTKFAADLESHWGLPSPSRPSLYISSSKPTLSPISHPSSSTLPSSPLVPSTFSIPVGYAHAEVLPGRTIRLRLVPPGRLTWAPGQHFFLCIPSVSKLVSHPFTCASVCDQKQGHDGRMIMFLIRAKNGWTKDLWTTIVGLLIGGHRHPAQEAPMGTKLPTTGVLLKAWVDGPFGSPARIDWSSYSAAMIVSGGSGVSFGISVLEYLCLCMAGRNGRSLGGNVGRSEAFPMQRIRFIWILRDFAHMQWCASVLHRCKLLVPQEVLQVDLFVTNFSPPPLRPPGLSDESMATLNIPDASFSRPTSTLIEVNGVPLNRDDLIYAHTADDGLVDLSYYGGDYKESGELGHEEHWLDLTNFDGENDDRMPGESSLNRAVSREGTIRRAITRKTLSRITRRHPDGAVDSGSSSRIDLPTPPRETDELISPIAVPPGGPSTSSLNSEDPGRTPTSSRPRSWVNGNQLMEGSQGWKRRSMALMKEASEEVKLEIGDQEMRDVSIMAEFARPGRPKLDLILRDEVAMADGPIVVAFCGPTTLNAVMRKVVAAQIEPLRIRRGEKNGFIDLVAEEFEY